ncbi:hypothetical protein SLS60_005912 [Paraconiothyrium brasiliense]|uniref:DUF6594 domain-containing protein n=1 Tax=Paraconiothyrium brasiliense TaxID=300254 RepID=A0ABR3RDH9_9PLEO
MSSSSQKKPGRSQDPERLDGIPLLSTFMATDEDAAIFRNFTRLGVRNLLHLQNRLNELEANLDMMDKEDAKELELNAYLRRGARAYDSIRDAAAQYEMCLKGGGEDITRNSCLDTVFLKQCYERVKIHEEIATVLHQYRRATIDEHQIRSLPKPSQSALATFKRYFKAGGSILIGHDKKVIQNDEDLIALGAPSEDDRLSRLVRYSCGYCLQSRKSPNPIHHPDIFYFPPRRVQILSYTITAILCGILLVGAMICLSLLDERSWKLRIALVALFTFLFAAFIALLTNARRAEVFGSTAAYAAVLVVYMSAGFGAGGRTGSM